ncbi:PAS domain S-box protein, partial [Streptomyces sp. NPDC058762]|uniref:PAS domain S-box protein n=1 Tax=Streptomyces sp. NPDC058762 TaxID=3346629 RepID=UPI00367B7338
MEDSSATVIVDARGLVTGWSDGARRLTGYTAEEVVGRPARDLLCPGRPPPPGSEKQKTPPHNPIYNWLG